MESLYPNIDHELKKRNMHYRELAREIGLSELQMYRRLKGKSNWQLVEVINMSKFFNHPDVNILFARR